jgi:hypothetical protein
MPAVLDLPYLFFRDLCSGSGSGSGSGIGSGEGTGCGSGSGIGSGWKDGFLSSLSKTTPPLSIIVLSEQIIFWRFYEVLSIKCKMKYKMQPQSHVGQSAVNMTLVALITA